MSSLALESFMQLKGIDPHFINAKGAPATVLDKDLKTIVQKLGFDGNDDAALEAYYHEEETRHWLSLLPSVSVFQQAVSYDLEVRLPIDFVTDPLIYRITTEDGLEIDQTLTATDFPLHGVNEISDVEFQLYMVNLSVDLEIGYHRLALLEEGNDEPLALMSLIIAPEACYEMEAELGDEPISVEKIQLDKVKNDRNWGIGDFSDLKEYIETSLKSKPSIVHFNPSELSESLKKATIQSHYLPLSSNGLNILYIDITAVPELSLCVDLQTKLSSLAFQQTLTSLRELQNNNLAEVAKTKIEALRVLFNALYVSNNSNENASRLSEFTSFVTQKGETLQKQATYDALQYKFSIESKPDINNASHYVNWPEGFQSFSSDETQKWIADNEQEVLFWCYCQWVAQEQLSAVISLAKSFPNRLSFYRVMSIGAAKNSSETWGEGKFYCQQVNIEAPLDNITPLNKTLGLSPFIPDQLYKSGYQPFIALLQSAMKYSGVVNIEHIAGLLRLWWVPENMNERTGSFVYYNVYDMLNIVALESERNQCVIVSDDLNTVPDGMDSLLEASRIYSTEMFV